MHYPIIISSILYYFCRSWAMRYNVTCPVWLKFDKKSAAYSDSNRGFLSKEYKYLFHYEFMRPDNINASGKSGDGIRGFYVSLH